jgi:hypothetical protein
MRPQIDIPREYADRNATLKDRQGHAFQVRDEGGVSK